MTGIEFAIVALAGVLIGRFLPNRRKGPKAASQPESVCGCGHHHGFHDPQTGRCHCLMNGKAIRFTDYPSRDPVAWEQVPCTCRQYSGPVPMPEFYAPEITTGEPS